MNIVQKICSALCSLIKKLCGYFCLLMAIASFALSCTTTPPTPFIIEFLVFAILSFLLLRNPSSKYKNDVQKESVAYIETDNITQRADNKPISDEEIPYLVQLGLEEAVKKNTTLNSKRGTCNCDGCPKQEVCTYGHIIYDEITGERMTLVDKFITLTVLNDRELKVTSKFDTAIIPDEHWHDIKLLLGYSNEELKNTLMHLQEMKKNYTTFGKCGRYYFSFMKMNDMISNLKKAIRESNKLKI